MRGRGLAHLQTVLIALLTLSLLALTFAFWLMDAPIQWDSGSTAAAAARALGLITPPPATIVLPRDLQYSEAARPIRVAWLKNESRLAVQLDPELTDSAYERLKDPLRQAMGSAKQALPRTFDDWLDALSSDSLYIEYATALPLRALALWLSSENTALPDAEVRRLALVSSDDAVALWFLDEQVGTPYMCPTALPARDIPGAVPPGALPCRFGFEDPNLNFPRAPMALLFQQTPRTKEADCAPVPLSPSMTEVTGFLKALHINPDTNARYSDEESTTYLDDTRLDDTRTCRFSQSGMIHYSDPEEIHSVSAASGAIEAIEQTRALLFALSPLLGQARFSLDSAVSSPDGSMVTVTFVYELAGLTVRLTDGPPAIFVFRNGNLTQADVRVLSFSWNDETLDLLPEEIVYYYLAGKHPYGDIDLRLSYAESDGHLTAGWENF